MEEDITIHELSDLCLIVFHLDYHLLVSSNYYALPALLISSLLFLVLLLALYILVHPLLQEKS